MRSAILLGMAMFLVATPALADEAAIKALSGKWVAVKIDLPPGASGPDDQKAELTVEGDKMKLKIGGRNLEFKIRKVDVNAKPNAIDLDGAGVTTGFRYRTIYALDGDELKFCLSESPDRPKEFKPDAEKSVSVITFKKSK